MKKGLVDFLEQNCLLNDRQHGFRHSHSTLSQLTEHLEEVASSLEVGGLVDVIYLDFAKAFDKVDFGVLMHCLQKLGVRGKLGEWLWSFLCNRKQYVHADGQDSKVNNVISGVPQGTVLGPLLFLILLTSIDDGVGSFTSSFADDTKIQRAVQSVEDAQLLQNDLNRIYEWAREFNMEFNAEKFQLLRYGTNDSLKAKTSCTTHST